MHTYRLLYYKFKSFGIDSCTQLLVGRIHNNNRINNNYCIEEVKMSVKTI